MTFVTLEGAEKNLILPLQDYKSENENNLGVCNSREVIYQTSVACSSSLLQACVSRPH